MLRVETDDADGEPYDVVLDVEPGHRIAELTAAVSAQVGRPDDGFVSLRSGRVLDPTATVDLADLVSGDAVRLGSRRAQRVRPKREPAIAIDLAVVGGPDAGESRLLVPGCYVVGRHPDCDVVLGDATVSRRHVAVTVHDDWRVTVRACDDASTPPCVNGCEIEGSLPVGDDDVITLGQTRLALRRFECAELRRNDRLGQVEFQRTPYRPPIVAERAAEQIGPIPMRPAARRFQLLAVLAPLAAGFVLYAFSRQLQFLALTLVSPLVMIANVVDDRRSGRRAMRDALVDFRDSLVCRRHELERLRSAERVERWHSAPDLSELLQRAARRSIDLWSCSCGAPDFLQLRLGLGSVTTAFEIIVEPGGEDDLRAEAVATHRRAHEAPRGAGHHRSRRRRRVRAPRSRRVGRRRRIVVDRPGRLLAQPGRPDHRRRDRGWSAVRLAEVVAARSLGDVAGRRPTCRDRHGRRRAGHGRPARRRSIPARRRWHRAAVRDAPLAAGDGRDRCRARRRSGRTRALLDLGPAVGITVVALAGRAADVPHQASSVLALSAGHAGAVDGTLWSTDPGVPGVAVEVERLRERLADRAARRWHPCATRPPRRSPPRSRDRSICSTSSAPRRPTGVASRSDGWRRPSTGSPSRSAPGQPG